MQNLAWLPENFNILLKKALCYDDFNINNFYVRIKAYQEILELCIDKADMDNLLPSNIKEIYAKEFQENTDNTDKDPNKIRFWKK